MEYKKTKSAAKKIEVKGPKLTEIILSTMSQISEIVGATLGPGGMPVLIERQDDLPPLITKDGVTVFKSLGFQDSAKQAILESARDCASRTASVAGDGSTCSTVLAEAFVRLTSQFCLANPSISPQMVVRKIQEIFDTYLEPAIKFTSIKVSMTNSSALTLLKAVAKVSANGDEELASAVMQCFALTGAEGNVTIQEISGPSRLEVERVEGYPLPVGFEECCGKFHAKFVNDPANQRCLLEKPVFICYHGKITEIQTLLFLLERIGTAWGEGRYPHFNVVVCATGFSESVLANLAVNFASPNTINVFPLLIPLSPMPNGQLDVLEDIAAVTGAKLLDPLNSPLDRATLEDLGPGVAAFEATRFRSNIVGRAEGTALDSEGRENGSYEDRLLLHIDNVKIQGNTANSELESRILAERLGKLTGGIARLKVYGSSSGEMRERKDRAEDAVLAVRGAAQHGCLPGGGWTLLKLIHELNNTHFTQQERKIIEDIVIPALREPVLRLYLNVGMAPTEVKETVEKVIEEIEKAEKCLIFDCMNHKYVDAVTEGVLDSVPAVLEALRNSISIATLLGTLGGIVVFARDEEFERSEAKAVTQYLRDLNTNPADERP